MTFNWKKRLRDNMVQVFLIHILKNNSVPLKILKYCWYWIKQPVQTLSFAGTEADHISKWVCIQVIKCFWPKHGYSRNILIYFVFWYGISQDLFWVPWKLCFSQLPGFTSLHCLAEWFLRNVSSLFTRSPTWRPIESHTWAEGWDFGVQADKWDVQHQVGWLPHGGRL